ncbi:hypothetical protein EDM00_04570 [Ornithobacterium rhinotracheale]|nr:hypothetical protein [Ornithobacterium rhinotracheale]MRJ08447.1 hypothetical protein [Ornithobacterium rhinotracheale]MRJ09985.1 hypothetical protein [Ornithobacterium rhinotracheale]
MAIFALVSCKNDDDSAKMIEVDEFRNVPVVSVEAKRIIVIKEQLNIDVAFKYNPACEKFYTINSEGLTYTPVVQNASKKKCNGNEITEHKSIGFSTETPGVYDFKFYAGTNDQGEKQYITKTVKVVTKRIRL